MQWRRPPRSTPKHTCNSISSNKSTLCTHTNRQRPKTAKNNLKPMNLASLTSLSASKHNGFTPRNPTASENTKMSCKHEARTKQGYGVRSQPNSCAQQRKKRKDHESFPDFYLLEGQNELS